MNSSFSILATFVFLFVIIYVAIRLASTFHPKKKTETETEKLLAELRSKKVLNYIFIAGYIFLSFNLIFGMPEPDLDKIVVPDYVKKEDQQNYIMNFKIGQLQRFNRNLKQQLFYILMLMMFGFAGVDNARILKKLTKDSLNKETSGDGVPPLPEPKNVG